MTFKKLILAFAFMLTLWTTAFAAPDTWYVISHSIGSRWECKDNRNFPFFFVVKSIDGKSGTAEGLYASQYIITLKGEIWQGDNGVYLKLKGTASNNVEMMVYGNLTLKNYGTANLKGTVSVTGPTGMGQEMSINDILKNSAMSDISADAWRSDIWDFVTFFTDNGIVSFEAFDFDGVPTHRFKLSNPSQDFEKFNYEKGHVNAKLKDGTIIDDDIVPYLYVVRQYTCDGLILWCSTTKPKHYYVTYMFAKADNPNEIGYFQGFMYDYDANTCHYIGPMDACHLYDMDRASADKRKTVLIPKGGYWFY